MATRSRITASLASRQFQSLPPVGQRIYSRAAAREFNAAGVRLSNAARHTAGMRAAASSGVAGG